MVNGSLSDKWAILQKRPLFGMARCLKIYLFFQHLNLDHIIIITFWLYEYI